ncbi:MAG: hypothetical protein JWR38_2891 [Mucilaginibacter sp.]|nr:hypothetical protein [Mucilaginibacter sp.]
MKKFKNGFLALALVAGISGGVISKIQAMPKQADASYEWQKFNHDGTRDPSLDETATISQATADYSCPGSVTLCASGTKVAGSGTGPNTATLRYSN